MVSLHDHHEDLPFAPGSSPFHIKGIVYRAHVEYVQTHVTGGPAAVNAGFHSAALRSFFEQPFLAASWYDVLPIVPLWHVTARALNLPSVEFLRVRTRHQARRDLHGVYRLLLKLASAELVAERVPRMVGQYFDFGTTSAKMVRRGVVRVEQTGVPMIIAPWLGIVGETFLQVALELAGARNIAVKRQPVNPEGMLHATPVGRMTADVSFDTHQYAAEPHEH